VHLGEAAMPTIKDRINITVEPELYTILTELADRKHMSLASYTKVLVERALDLEEDRYFSLVAEKRIAENQTSLDHEDAWR
jgi:predicted DNA-binding protein